MQDGIEPAFQLAKRQRVSAQEERWVEVGIVEGVGVAVANLTPFLQKQFLSKNYTTYFLEQHGIVVWASPGWPAAGLPDAE